MDSDNLKNCPFCGGNNLRIPKSPIITPDYKDFKMYETTVSCSDCGADGPKIAYVDNVRKSWNERK